jgi:hypothetical protein
MRVITIIVAGLIALATVGAAVAGGASGGVTGKITLEDGSPASSYSVLVISADTPQPASFADIEEQLTLTDTEGSFSVSGLADGDYLVVPWVSVDELINPLPETFGLALEGEESVADEVMLFAAQRVTVSGGATASDLEFAVRTLTLEGDIMTTLEGTDTTSHAGAPVTPAASSGESDWMSTGVIAAIVGAAALAMAAAGGCALRARLRSVANR